MNWYQVGEAAILASVLSSFTDWYFFGIMFHDRYHSTPGVWRQYKDKKDEIKSVTIGTLYGSVTSIVFVISCAYWDIYGYLPALITAGILWIMIPMPLLLSNAQFMKIDRRLVISHGLGWLARLVVSALSVGLCLKSAS